MIRVVIVAIGLFLSPHILMATQADPAAQIEAADPPSTPGGVDAQEVTGQAGSGLPERAPQARTMRAYWHVFIAFGVTWVLLFGYAISVGRRFGRLESELRKIESTGSGS